MPSVGTILRGARLQSGLTHEQITGRTCIQPKILQALEEDDLGKISSAFFYKSFVRQMAQALSLPYERVAAQVEEAAAFYPEPFRPDQLHSVAQHAVVRTRRRNVNMRTLLATASAVLVLAGCSVVYSYWEGGKSEASSGASAAFSTAKSWLKDLLPGAGNVQSKTQSVVSSSDKKAVVAADEAIRVQVSAIEPSWLSIVADGHQTFSGVLEADQSKFMECRDNGRVRTGNAGGLKVVFNGKPVGIVGPRGQVRIVVFTRDNYQVLEPSASASLRDPAPLLRLDSPQLLLSTAREFKSFDEQTQPRPLPW